MSYIHITDHYLLRYMERHMNLDLSRIKREAALQIMKNKNGSPIVKLGDGNVAILRGSVAKTLVPETSRINKDKELTKFEIFKKWIVEMDGKEITYQTIRYDCCQYAKQFGNSLNPETATKYFRILKKQSKDIPNFPVTFEKVDGVGVRTYRPTIQLRAF